MTFNKAAIDQFVKRLTRHLSRDEASQMVEFALTLPLLVVFVVGIFDFSNAFTLKQKLTNVARDAARVAAADPASDVPLSVSAVPASVSDAFQLVANYLVANNINACGMTASSFVYAAPATWTYSAHANGCPAAGITVIINRGYYFPQATGTTPASVTCAVTGALGGQPAVIGTCVSLQYAYQWKFGHAASLLGASTTLPSTISAAAVSMNEN
jgi:Flp pilus assembly protein TadG